MRISTIKTEKALKGLGYGVLFLTTGALSYVSFKDMPDVISRQKAKNEAERELVKTYNPELYNDFMENGYGLHSWEDAAKQIQDSLKIDSIAKTNYALGMQAVRDSLANANKK